MAVILWRYNQQVAAPFVVLGGVGAVWYVWKIGQGWSIGDSELRVPYLVSVVAKWAYGTVVSLPAEVRAWDTVDDVARTLFPFVVVLFLKPIVSTIVAAIRLQPDGDAQGHRTRGRPRPQGTLSNAWVVTVLLVTALECQRARRLLVASGGWAASTATVSLRSAERAIWRIQGSSENGFLRLHHRRFLNEHFGQVVGALRTAEVKQSVDRAEALHEMTRLLLKIAYRCAEGRVGQLLDEQDLTGSEKVVHRMGLRLLAVGVVVVGVIAAAVVFGLPEGAIVPLLPLLVIGAVMLFHRGKGPSPEQLQDLVIPR
ncbi:hypothetical protein ACIPW5_10925 [Streptomyces sp. NPDC090077]|uniref:hypothetical protein n=1 Tax=Streptomyces sp. NPDC090077 TaxID=3365938 RepID=UPI00381D9550